MNLKKYLSFLALICVAPTFADKGLSLELGNVTPLGKAQNNLDFSAHVWHRIDPMVSIGIGSGVQALNEDFQVPLMGALYMRLPIGRTLMPIAVGDFGYRFGYKPGMAWRYGGGFDLKLGSKSCIIGTAGIDGAQGSAGRFFSRAGLLFEF
jgi:hypothetical protein